jgi:PPK2 family polyphosphate:nucleotide phosphotransferase
MNARKEFRAAKDFKLSDKRAGDKPLSGKDTALDKERVLDMAEHIAKLQDIFYAEHKRKLLVILQGMDTSGKDGTIRGVFGRIDPLGIRTVAFKAPSTTEREHDYLWRVHQQVPGAGEFVIFNRSHYEDVLVPRVHGNIDASECKRRYAHIRDFERMLMETGTVFLKFFLHISKDEQKERLEARLADPAKHWKFDSQDLAERKFWNEYQAANEDAIGETDTDQAPWYVIPANSKTHRNLAIASIVLDTMQEMKFAYPEGDKNLATLKIE